MDQYLGKEVTVKVVTIFKDGWYECKHYYTQKRSLDLINWEEKEIGLKAFGKTPEKAYAEVLLQLNNYMKGINFDLFGEEDAKNIEAGKTQ